MLRGCLAKTLIVLSLLSVALSVQAMCQIAVWSNATEMVDFFVANTLKKDLIGHFDPNMMRRRFQKNLCLDHQYVYAKSEQQVYHSKQRLDNKDQLLLLQFPEDFIETSALSEGLANWLGKFHKEKVSIQETTVADLVNAQQIVLPE